MKRLRIADTHIGATNARVATHKPNPRSVLRIQDRPIPFQTRWLGLRGKVDRIQERLLRSRVLISFISALGHFSSAVPGKRVTALVKVAAEAVLEENSYAWQGSDY